MDKKLLLDLFKIPAMSGDEGKVSEFIQKQLKILNIDFTVDNTGNIFNVSNPNRPLLCAHMDTVQSKFDTIMSKFVHIVKGEILKGYGVIGGDDKCGIFAILELLKEGHKDVNFLFTVEEESGAVGSTMFVSENDISEIPYGIILDRRGSGDIICYRNDYGTIEFENAISEIGKVYGFKPSVGTFSDADQLNEQISCANLSVGYYNAHTKNEFVVLSELQNTINYVNKLLTSLEDQKFEAPETFKYKNITAGKFDPGYDDYYDDYYDAFGNSFKSCDVCYGFKKDHQVLKTLNMIICDECLEELEEEIYELTIHKRTSEFGE